MKRLFGAGLFLGLMMLAGCGNEGTAPVTGGAPAPPADPEKGSVSFSLIWGSTRSALVSTARAPSGDVCVDYGITEVAARLSNGTSDVASGRWPCAQRSGKLNSISPGTNYAIIVEGYVGPSMTWRGQKTNIAVSAGQETQAGQIAMNYVGGADTTPPRVVAPTMPADGAIDVPLSAAVVATFSEDIVEASIMSPGAFSVTPAGGGSSISGSVSYDRNTYTATFTPLSALSPGTNYTALISATVEDLAGYTMAGDYAWSFRTVLPDSTAPKVQTTVPISATTDVPLDAVVSVTFSENILESTLAGTGFQLQDQTGTPVPGTLTYDPATHTATITPSSLLGPGTIYHIVVTTAVTDPSGNALNADYLATFTTVYDQVWFLDADGDGYSDGTNLSAVTRPTPDYFLSSELIATSGDCLDSDPAIHPGATDTCGDGIDQDCSGADAVCPGPAGLTWGVGNWDETVWN